MSIIQAQRIIELETVISILQREHCDLRAELIRSYEVAEELRQILFVARNGTRIVEADESHPVLRVVDDLSFDNVTELSRSMIQHPTNGDDIA